MTAPMRSRLYLEMPVQFLKGVGEGRARLLDRLNIHTAGDLLFHVPHRYDDASTITPISGVDVGQDVTVIGRVISKGVLPTRRGLRIFQAVLRDESGMIEAAWPGQPFLDRSIQKNDVLLASGPCRFFHGRQLQPREWVNLGAEDTGSAAGRVLAVYPATEGLTVRQLRALIDRHLDSLVPLVEEHLPDELLGRLGLPGIGEALRLVHRPTSVAEAGRGRSRLAFDELFFVQILHRRANATARAPRAGIVFEPRRTLTSRLKESLPYVLTGAQVRAIREIFADMSSPRRMHRLLQGDVGSGKTVVAVFAALLAMENGYQAALMAPTELLAEQHERTLAALLAPLGIAPLLVTGSMGAAERRAAILLSGSPAESILTSQIFNSVSPATRPHVIDLPSLFSSPKTRDPGPKTLSAPPASSLSLLKALIARCSLMVTNDTGPRHIAAALGVPTVSLFGPETPALYGPVGDNHLVFYSGHWCSPCLSVYNAKIAMCHGENECMRRITLDEVVQRTAVFARERVGLAPPRRGGRELRR